MLPNIINKRNALRLIHSDFFKIPVTIIIMVMMVLIVPVSLHIQRQNENEPALNAIKTGNYVLLETLARRDGTLGNQFVNWRNDTMLSYVVRRQDKKALSILLENGANPNFRATPDTVSTLQFCVTYSNDIEMCKMLIDHGADINAKGGRHSTTALHDASFSCKPKIAKFLIENGADTRAKNLFKDTPLETACESGCKDIVILLLNSGPINRAVKDNAIRIAESHGYVDIANIIRKHRASDNRRDE